MRPEEEIPEVEAGDRVVIIVVERPDAGGSFSELSMKMKPRPRLVILEATEDGWRPIDEAYGGYTPEDGVLWALEKDVCGIARVLDLC